MGKLAVSVPWSHSYAPWSFFESLWGSDIPRDETAICRGRSHDVTNARNITIKKALEWGADEILLVDADQHIPKDVLKRLRAHGEAIVGALTPVRKPPYNWSLYRELPGQDTHMNVNPFMPLQEVDATGIGCMLVRREVFEKIGVPWFKRTFSEDGCEMTESDDIFFCRKARAAGYRIFVDTTLESYHEHEVTLCAETLGRKIEYLEVFA